MPPYSYRWMALPGNTGALDNIYSATPKVTGLSSNPYSKIIYFLLTVTDSSPVKKLFELNRNEEASAGGLCNSSLCEQLSTEPTSPRLLFCD